MKLIQVTCCNDDCDHQFRIPEYQYGKSIKNNPDKQECTSCKNRKLLEKSQSKRVRNQKPVKKTAPVRKKKKRRTWEDKPLNKLIEHVQAHFCNPYIRWRDNARFRGKCISCNGKLVQAGHFFPVSTHGGMRFRINNIHGQTKFCNCDKDGNLEEYEKGLIKRHGEKYLENLKDQERIYRLNGHKFYRHEVIEIGRTYQYLTDNRIWIFTPDEFDQYRETLFQ
jgi:hypothetical protein